MCHYDKNKSKIKDFVKWLIDKVFIEDAYNSLRSFFLVYNLELLTARTESKYSYLVWNHD